MLGIDEFETTVKSDPLLTTPLTVTTTFPVIAPVGTCATIWVPLQLVMGATVPLKLTALVPWVAPKFIPVIATDVPAGPEVGDKLVIIGETITVTLVEPQMEPTHATAVTEPTATPVPLPRVLESLETVAMASLEELQAELPVRSCVLPSANVPVAVNCWVPPTVSVGLEGERAIETSDGPVVSVNDTPLLASPYAVTTTLPVVVPDGTVALTSVSLQLVAVATTPLNVTVLVPWLEPKFMPMMSMLAPTSPDVGLIPEMEGVAITVKGNTLLAEPPTVTTIFPVVAPKGTVALIAVVLQLVTVATNPLNVSVLVPCVEPKFEPAI
jgi:hypothetical protein